MLRAFCFFVLLYIKIHCAVLEVIERADDLQAVFLLLVNGEAVFNDGDAVITSPLSTKFLPGILIGYASDISINSQHLTKSGKLIPVADFDNIQEVLVITQVKTEDGIVTPGEL